MPFKTETSAGGIVFKKETNSTLWFIIQNSHNNGWAFPKGNIGDKVRHEKPEEAAIREVQEEGGIQVKIVDPEPVTIQYMYRFQGYLIKKTVHYFLMEYQNGDPKDHDWEVSDAKFLTEDEMKKTLSYKGDKEAFEKMLLRKPVK